MYPVRQTVALLLISVGSLLLLLGAMVVVVPPPADVSPEVARFVAGAFLLGGLLGLGLFSWGVRLRSTLHRGGGGLLWAVYALLLVLFLALGLFVGPEVVRLVGDVVAESGPGEMVVAVPFLLAFLLGPLVLEWRAWRGRGRQGPPPPSPG